VSTTAIDDDGEGAQAWGGPARTPLSAEMGLGAYWGAIWKHADYVNFPGQIHLFSKWATPLNSYKKMGQETYKNMLIM
jgi:hypothetical protein